MRRTRRGFSVRRCFETFFSICITPQKVVYNPHRSHAETDGARFPSGHFSARRAPHPKSPHAIPVLLANRHCGRSPVRARRPVRLGHGALHFQRAHRHSGKALELFRLDHRRLYRAERRGGLSARCRARRLPLFHAVPVSRPQGPAGHHPAGPDRLCLCQGWRGARPHPDAGLQRGRQ